MDKIFNLSFHNLSYNADILIPFKRKQQKLILKSINGEFRGNQMSAIVGLSGSGKSSLLDCLSGFRRENISGEIMLNGMAVSTKVIKLISSYVMQEQTLHGLLTVSEIMSLSMNLRDKQKLTKIEKDEKIIQILEKFSIESQYNRYVKDLSGGERKRLQIAVELVTDPAILFLDECTTGLDIVSSSQCIDILKRLAKDGRTIICSIHQPSASMLMMFDRIYALSDGCCIYQGTSKNLVTFFRDVALPCPATYNPADYLLELANNDYGSQIHQLIEKIENGKNASYTNDAETLDGCTEGLTKLKIETSSQATKFSASYVSQVYYLMHRLFLITSRDPSLFYMRIFVHIFVGIIFGLTYQDVGNKASSMFDNYRFLVITVVFLLYTSYHSLYLAFPSEFPIIKREHFNGWYSTRAYFSAFMLFDLPITFLCGLSYISITYWMTDQPKEIDRYLMFLVFGLLLSYAAQSLAIMVTALMTIKVAAILGIFFLTPFFLFSGVMVTTKDANPLFRNFFYGNFLDCGLKGILNSVLGFGRQKLECDEIYCHFGDPKKVLRDFGADDSLIRTFVVIMLHIMFCQVMSFILFRYRLKKRLT